MKNLYTLQLKFNVLLVLLTVTVSCFAQSKNRLVVLADMGNEPDEEQQIMHLLMYANEFDLEGLIAVTGKFLRPEAKRPYKQKLHPELFASLIEGYGQVVENLKKHAEGWPDPDYLRTLVASGQPGYGMGDVGPGKSSPGSRLLIDILERDDPRPVYIVANAGSNTLAQALRDYRELHSPDDLDKLVSKIQVYENGAQDDAGAWICAQFPAIHWIRSNYQTYCYAGPSIDGGANNQGDRKSLGPHTWEPYAYSGIGQHQWALEHIIGNHGAFGKYYPLRQFPRGGISFLEGGGTIPWLGLVHQGLSDPAYPHWGGWSGRFTRDKVENVWSKHGSVSTDEKAYAPFSVYTENSDQWMDEESGKDFSGNYAPVWRWRRAFFNDFKCRMDWCKGDYASVNHNPIAAINGDKEEKIHFVSVKGGEILAFDASASEDPDHDRITYNWWIYREAGTYEKPLEIGNPDQSKIEVSIPGDAKGKEIHLILEIKDDHQIASMYDYRRVVITIE